MQLTKYTMSALGTLNERLAQAERSEESKTVKDERMVSERRTHDKHTVG